MKKVLTLALAVLMACSMSVTAFAATTTLTTTVPEATYTLNIPANQEIPFGTTSADIGTISVTESAGFAKGKNLDVTITYGPFTATGISTEIPYNIVLAGNVTASENDDEIAIASGDKIHFLGRSTGAVSTYPVDKDNHEYLTASLVFNALSTDWGKALAGEYSTTITFTAEVVAE